MEAIISSSLLLLFILSSLLCSPSSSAKPRDLIQCLTTLSTDSDRMTKVLYTPQNTSYTSILQFSAQNLRFAKPSASSPALIVTPIDASQIQTVFTCAKENGFRVRVRSGGHDYEGLSYVSRDPFVMIDMINLKSINVDASKRTAWVQGGANLGEVYYGISEKSKTLGFPAGVCPTVGVGGLISGGGYGPLVRKYGLAADNVLGVQYMDVNGNIFMDKRSLGKDVFWAIRGGIASNFGVVLAWKLRLVPVPKTVTVFAVQRTLEQNGTALVHKWQSIAPIIDKELLLMVNLTAVTQGGKRTIQFTFRSLFLGRASRLLSIMQKHFPELGLVRKDCREMSWVESTLFFAYNSTFVNEESLNILLNRTAPSKLYFKARSDFVKSPISVEGLEGFWKRIFQLEDGVVNIIMTPFGGRMNEISESETPFPHRAGNLYLMYEAVTWDSNTPDVTQRKRLNSFRMLYGYLAPYVSKNPRQAYVNYNDLDLGVATNYDEAKGSWGNSYFKDNFERLVQIKSIVDPNNFLKHEQSIPTLTSE